MTEQTAPAADRITSRRSFLKGMTFALAAAAGGAATLPAAAAAAKKEDGKSGKSGSNRKDDSSKNRDNDRDRNRGRDRRPRPTPAPADPTPTPTPVPAPSITARYSPVALGFIVEGQDFQPGASIGVEIYGNWCDALKTYLYDAADTWLVREDGSFTATMIVVLPTDADAIAEWDYIVRFTAAGGMDFTLPVDLDIWSGL
ncbi:MAG: hypothetical protein ACR2J8_12080 [Thermomicrobiales bacterium]